VIHYREAKQLLSVRDGETAVGVAWTAVDLGRAMAALGDTDGAREQLEETLRICKMQGAAQDVTSLTARAKYELAKVVAKQPEGEHPMGQELFQEVMEDPTSLLATAPKRPPLFTG